MNNVAELDRIKQLLLDLETKYQVLLYNRSVLEKEQAQLVLIQAQLNENINALRQQRVVALALEFKKARDDLIRTQIRLNLVSRDLETLVRACNTAKDMIDKGKQDYAKVLKGLESVVIQGNFRSRDGQKSD